MHTTLVTTHSAADTYDVDGNAPQRREAISPTGYLSEPDTSHPAAATSPGLLRSIRTRLKKLYGEEGLDALVEDVDQLIREHNAHKTEDTRRQEARNEASQRLTERDVALITYGDLVASAGRRPLETLGDFVSVFFEGLITILHVLPFYPYSSDRGFSVLDYRDVDAKLGTWEDIAALKRSFKLMFDGVFNHVSSRSRWFQDFLHGRPEVKNDFITFKSPQAIDPEHRKLILRPRTHDLLTGFDTADGRQYVWTTFSPDQIDLNFKNPSVLLRILDVLLFYVRKGADVVRLDAVTFLWYELGTSCAHLDETHEVVKLVRDVLDAAAPHVTLITETNVPHAENMTYFGNGRDEAQMVYNFALPPLVLHAFQTERTERLTAWAKTLETPSDRATFFNFLDSHDGIGLMGARDYLTGEEIDDMCRRVRDHGGLVSMRDDGKGSASPYELNITWYSALNREDGEESTELQVDRFIASRAMALVLQGVPAVYLPSIFGSRNDLEAVYGESSHRDINRGIIRECDLLASLQNPMSPSHQIARRYIHLLEKRVAEKSFHPSAQQQVLSLDNRLFAVARETADDRERVACLTSVSSEELEIELSLDEIGFDGLDAVDLLSGTPYENNGGTVRLLFRPYQVIWLKPDAAEASHRGVSS